MLGKTNAVGKIGSGQGDVLFAVTDAAPENVSACSKVILNKNTSVQGHADISQDNFNMKNVVSVPFFGNKYCFCSDVYEINDDLTISKVTQLPLSMLDSYSNYVTKNGDVYAFMYNTPVMWSSYNKFFYNTSTGFAYKGTAAPLTKFINNSPYYLQQIVTSSTNKVDIYKFENNTDVLVYEKSLPKDFEASDFLYNDLLITTDSSGKQYVYKIDFEAQSDVLLATYTDICKRTGSVWYSTFQVSDNKYLKFANGRCYLYTISNDGSIEYGLPDTLGYTINSTSFNPSNNTFVFESEKILHVLQFDAETNKFQEIITTNLSELLNQIKSAYPDAAKSFAYTAISDDLTRFGIVFDKTTNSVGCNLVVVSLKNNLSEWIAQVDNVSNYGMSSLTGFFTGNTDENGLAEVKTTLPPLLTVNLMTVPTAEIITQGDVK